MQLNKADANIDTQLAHVANHLRQTDLFTGHSDNWPLVEKQAIFLVAAGCKPVGEATSGHWVKTADGRKSVYDDPERIKQFLTSLGLFHAIRFDDYGTDAVVAKSQDDILRYEQADDARTVGKLFGYPETAFEAFEQGQSMSIANQDALEKQIGLSQSFFRFSNEHWEAESEVALDWWRKIVRYGMDKT